MTGTAWMVTGGVILGLGIVIGAIAEAVLFVMKKNLRDRYK